MHYSLYLHKNHLVYIRDLVEWSSEWLREWVVEWVSGWVSERLSECAVEWVVERVSGWVSAQLSECAVEWVVEWVSGWVSELLSEWVSCWVSEWVVELVSEWASLAREWMKQASKQASNGRTWYFLFSSNIWLDIKGILYTHHFCLPPGYDMDSSPYLSSDPFRLRITSCPSVASSMLCFSS